MKCNDISQLLNERELSELSPAETAALEAHVLDCAACAAQCLASERMTVFRPDTPPMPASLHEQVRRLRAVCEATTSPRSTRRPVIIGSLFLLGAATMFAAIPLRGTSTANR